MRDYVNSIWSGLYIVHLARWFRQFDAADIMVVQSEYFFKNPKEVFLDTLQLVNLDASLVDAEQITKQVFNAAPKAVEEETNEEEVSLITDLKQLFRPFNKALSDFLLKRNIKFDLGLWKDS